MNEALQPTSTETNDNQPILVEQFEAPESIDVAERTQLHDEVVQSYEERNAYKSRAVEDMLVDINKLYDEPEQSVDQSRTVLFEGTEQAVVDSYSDANGNEWVEFADGRQTMKHQEIVDTHPADTVAETVEQPAPVQQTAELPTQQGIDATAAAEAHLAEVLAGMNFIKPPKKEDVIETIDEGENLNEAEPELNEQNDQEQENEQNQEKQKLLQQLQQGEKKYKSAQRAELSSMDTAGQVLSQMKQRLMRTPGRSIDSVLFAHINQALQDADSNMRRVKVRGQDKDSNSHVVEGLLLNAESTKTPQLADFAKQLSRLGKRDKAITPESIGKILRNSEPRGYRNDKDEFVRTITKVINKIEAMKAESTQDGQRFSSLLQQAMHSM